SSCFPERRSEAVNRAGSFAQPFARHSRANWRRSSFRRLSMQTRTWFQDAWADPDYQVLVCMDSRRKDDLRQLARECRAKGWAKDPARFTASDLRSGKHDE